MEKLGEETSQSPEVTVEDEVHPLEREANKALSFSTEMFVQKHQATETANKDPVYVVHLKTIPTNPFQAELKIKHETDTIFVHFPMHEGFNVSISTAQTKLP